MLMRMKDILKSGFALAVVATSFAAFIAPAQAAEVGAGSYQVADNWNGHNWRGGGGGDWRWRHHGGGWHGGGWHGGGWNGDDWGGAAAAGILGLATGAIIANSANQPYYDDSYDSGYVGGYADGYVEGYAGDYVSYCASRYRTFDPSTGTYIGYDGYPHRCVMP